MRKKKKKKKKVVVEEVVDTGDGVGTAVAMETSVTVMSERESYMMMKIEKKMDNCWESLAVQAAASETWQRQTTMVSGAQVKVSVGEGEREGQATDSAILKSTGLFSLKPLEHVLSVEWLTVD